MSDAMPWLTLLAAAALAIGYAALQRRRYGAPADGRLRPDVAGALRAGAAPLAVLVLLPLLLRLAGAPAWTAAPVAAALLLAMRTAAYLRAGLGRGPVDTVLRLLAASVLEWTVVLFSLILVGIFTTMVAYGVDVGGGARVSAWPAPVQALAAAPALAVAFYVWGRLAPLGPKVLAQRDGPLPEALAASRAALLPTVAWTTVALALFGLVQTTVALAALTGAAALAAQTLVFLTLGLSQAVRAAVEVTFTTPAHPGDLGG